MKALKKLKLPKKKISTPHSVFIIGEALDPCDRPLTDAELQAHVSPYWKEAAQRAKLKG